MNDEIIGQLLFAMASFCTAVAVAIDQSVEAVRSTNALTKVLNRALDISCRENAHCDLDLAELNTWPDTLDFPAPQPNLN